MRKQTSTTTNGENKMTQDEWLEYGYENSFCSRSVCAIHDGFPTTIAEDKEFDGGHDPCIHAVRLYKNKKMRDKCENKHQLKGKK